MDKSITVQADTVILDGRSYNKLVCSAPISAHSEGMIEVSVKDCKNFNPSTVGADLIYFDTDTYDNDVKMNLVSKKENKIKKSALPCANRIERKPLHKGAMVLIKQYIVPHPCEN